MNGNLLTIPVRPGAGVFLFFLPFFFIATTGFAQEADLLIPEGFSAPVPLHLRPDFENRAEETARFLQALFEEETDGPDRALDTKRKLLELDPGFTDLAIEVAHQYLRRGEISEAISVLKDAAKAVPQSAEPFVALAGIYLHQLQKADLAEKFGLQALSANPDGSAPYQILFEIYKSGKETQKIESLFAKAIKRNSPDADFWLDLADLRLRAGNRGSNEDSKIVEILDRAQEFAGDHAETLSRVGDYFVLCNHPERAIPLYQLALKLGSSAGGLRDKLAACFIQSGNTLEAARLLEEMLKDNPLDFRIYDQLADLYLRVNEPSKALANLKQAILIAPADPRRYSDLVQLCLRVREPESAIVFAGDAEKIFPKMLEFKFLEALALSEAKRHEEAIKTFEAILVEANISSPSILNADFYFSYGVSAEQAGLFAKAAEALKKSIEIDPANAGRACNYLGYMWADRNENLDDAETMIRRAVELEPGNGAYLDSLGWVYFRKGKYAEALNELLRAAELLQEDDAVVFEHIGDTYEKLGKSAEAVIYWQKAYRLDGENPALSAKLDACASRIAQKPAPPQKAASH